MALLDALGSNDSGLIISVDEAQVGGARLVQDISSLLTSARNSRWPVNFLIAGLHSMRKLVAPSGRNAGSLGQLERASWLPVAPRLTRPETRFAVVEALQLTDPAWKLSDNAATRVFELTAGYPYAVQLLGSELWGRLSRARGESTSATSNVSATPSPAGWPSHCSRRGGGRCRPRSAATSARWPTSSPVAAVTNAQVAERLGKRPNETTYLRERLLDSGVIVVGAAPRTAEFITPLFADYVLQHSEDD